MHIETFERRKHSISLTPLIDVVFLLLIFFLLTSSIQQAQQESNSRESTIAIELPEAQSGTQSTQSNPVVLTVDGEGKVVMEGGEDLQGDSIEAQLQDLYKKKPEAPILLRGDQGASHGDVIQLLDSVKQLGFKRVDLVIAKPKSDPETP